MFAEAAPPPLSEGFLARLQSLPGTGLEGDPEGRTGAVDADGRWDASRGPGRPGGNAFGESFSLIPAAVAPHRDRSHRDRGFRVHAVPDASRGSRSRRFAFAAAGAVSLAAFALGGAQPLASVAEAPGARAEDPRATATPLARTTGGVRDDGRLLPLGFTAATRPAPAAPGAPTPPGAPLLRPSTAAPLPPLARAALPGSGGPTGDSAR
ncbi:hypothetical protein SMD11_2413 [Streptomyces albireticuli]|uniref:Uncharacterized protein n=1 Tax=Streptomyces albireticuli TaxID=1940 RepID=A0A1Z2L178_9ACTN|nr:hypothetical protein SMD11_2413 [Streptomyces albireticuli]